MIGHSPSFSFKINHVILEDFQLVIIRKLECGHLGVTARTITSIHTCTHTQ